MILFLNYLKPWISHITISDVYSLLTWLIQKLGSEVNIANVDPDDILCLEAERKNLEAHMRYKYIKINCYFEEK